MPILSMPGLGVAGVAMALGLLAGTALAYSNFTSWMAHVTSFVYGLFVIGVPVFALIGLFGPAAQGTMSRRVSASEQGRLQGANASIMGITGLAGPGLFTATSICELPERKLNCRFNDGTARRIGSVA